MGYAPNDWYDLMGKEIEIKNKSLAIVQWFIAVFIIYLVFSCTIIGFLAIDDYREFDGLSQSEINNVAWYLAYLTVIADLSALLTIFFPLLLPQRHFKIGFYYTILQWFPFIVCIFIFNQQLFCGPKADLLKRKLIFSFVAQFFTIPLLIINTYISAQVYLIISKLRPEYDGDDSYEVIEGSEGSSTKKIDLS